MRFSRKNPFDFILFDTEHGKLYALELKTVNKKSISFERTGGESGEIHRHQIEGLRKWSQYKGTVCGFVIEFRPIATTLFIDIDAFCKLMELCPKKSFTVEDLKTYGIPHFIIPQARKKTHCSYDIDSLLKNKPA